MPDAQSQTGGPASALLSVTLPALTTFQQIGTSKPTLKLGLESRRRQYQLHVQLIVAYAGI